MHTEYHTRRGSDAQSSSGAARLDRARAGLEMAPNIATNVTRI